MIDHYKSRWIFIGYHYVLGIEIFKDIKSAQNAKLQLKLKLGSFTETDIFVLGNQPISSDWLDSLVCEVHSYSTQNTHDREGRLSKWKETVMLWPTPMKVR